MKIAVLGSGTWGTTLAKLLVEKGHSVCLWSKFQSQTDRLKKEKVHDHLPGCILPDSLEYSSDIEEACAGAKMIVFATPSCYIRETAMTFKPYYRNQIVVTAAKGIENDTLFTTSEIIEDVLGIIDEVVALSGPTHAEEVSKNIPTTIVSSCPKLETAVEVQSAFSTSYFRVYTNFDRKGVELCGAFKNIIALACGISDGMGFGDNTKAALITRGIKELKRLGTTLGCNEDTFSGLSGTGDLVVTATSKHSRNNNCGYLIGQGVPVDEAIKQIGMVVEGIISLDAAVKLCTKFDIYMPIVTAVDDIINKNRDKNIVVQELFSKDLKSE